MTGQSQGVAWGNWLVSKASGLLDARLSRRSFIARTTLVGTAVAATGCAVVTQPGPPYQRITDCPPGTLCTDGYTEFCCVINQGVNACPPDTTPAGWWRADGSIYCGGGPRYYIDCNELCCGPDQGNGFCAGCSPCRCATDCNTRKVHCNYFRYGQCNVQIPEVGPIACRMVLCVPPYPPYTLLACGPSSAVDDATANHNADCAAYAPGPPPPPPLAKVLPAAAAGFLAGSKLTVATRFADGALWHQTFNGSSWSGWASVGGQVNSSVVGVAQGSSGSVFMRGTDSAAWSITDTGGSWGPWTSLGGQFTSDPAAVVDHKHTTLAFARGTDYALWSVAQTGGAWESLGGALDSGPAAVVDGSGTVWVFIRGTDNALWAITRSGGSWGGWTGFGGALTSDPAPVVDGSGNVSVFIRGDDNALWTTTLDGGWTLLGGELTSDPSPVVDPSGTVWVFIRGTDGGLWAITDSGGSWGGWSGLGGQLASDPIAVVDASGTVRVFIRGVDNALWTITPGGAWASLGGDVATIQA